MSVEVSGNYQERRLAIFHLSLIEDVGPGAIAKILKYGAQHTDLWENFYQYSAADWEDIGLSEGAASRAQQGLADKNLLDRELVLMEKHAVRLVVLGDADYPSLLSHIHTPPAVLYYQGASLDSYQKTMAIVGSRAADSYGERVIASFVPELIAHKFAIVSGGALGADTMAHKAALEAEGRTIAVLGSGLLQPYPRGNIKLFDRIIAQGGSIVSQYPLLVEPHPHNFPARNRIISGLSSACVVVQAAAKSGASITAEYALQQGRQVFAVPGVFDHPLSEGCHALLKEGAAVAGSVTDILLELGEIMPEKNVNSKVGSKLSSDAGSGARANSGTKTSSGVSVASHRAEQQVSLIPASTIKSGFAQAKPATIQDYILALCAQPCSIDFLAQQCARPVSDIQQLLFDLQLDGAVRQEFTGQWVAS